MKKNIELKLNTDLLSGQGLIELTVKVVREWYGAGYNERDYIKTYNAIYQALENTKIVVKPL